MANDANQPDKTETKSDMSNTELSGGSDWPMFADGTVDKKNSRKPEDSGKPTNQPEGDESTTNTIDGGASVNSEDLESGGSTASDPETNQALSQEPESQGGSSKTDSDQADPAISSDTGTSEPGPVGGNPAKTATKYCTQCGAEMPADGAFCTECGNELL